MSLNQTIYMTVLSTKNGCLKIGGMQYGAERGVLPPHPRFWVTGTERCVLRSLKCSVGYAHDDRQPENDMG